MDLECSERALRQCFNFGIRVVEIVETFETNLETCLEDFQLMFIFFSFLSFHEPGKYFALLSGWKYSSTDFGFTNLLYSRLHYVCNLLLSYCCDFLENTKTVMTL